MLSNNFDLSTVLFLNEHSQINNIHSNRSTCLSQYVTIKYSLDGISTLSKAYLARQGCLHAPANSTAMLAAMDNHARQVWSDVLTKDTPAFGVESWAQH
jgi:hypothetical protein